MKCVLVWLLLWAGCAVEASPATPAFVQEPPASEPASDAARLLDAARQRALRGWRVPFVAEQRVRMIKKGKARESHAVFTMWPGRAYRVRASTIFNLTVLDLQVRCGRYRYAVPFKLYTAAGPFERAIDEVPSFPVVALWQMYDASIGGTWEGVEYTAADASFTATMDPARGVFTTLRSERPLPVRMQIHEFVAAGDVLLPARTSIDLGERGMLELVTDRVRPEAPRLDQIAPEVKCAR